MLDYLLSVLYGIVEGITEWLPISSTGHLIILEELLPMKIQPAVWDLFLVVIQLGAILATVILFWQKIWPFQKPDKANGVSIFKKESWMLWFKVAVASIPGVFFKLLGLDDILTRSINGSGCNEEYGLLGANKATEDKIKLFPRNCNEFVNSLQEEMYRRTGKKVEAGFSYSSGNNSQWLCVCEIQERLKKELF